MDGFPRDQGQNIQEPNNPGVLDGKGEASQPATNDQETSSAVGSPHFNKVKNCEQEARESNIVVRAASRSAEDRTDKNH